MTQALSVVRNDYLKRPKGSVIFTPGVVGGFLHGILSGRGYSVVFDPAIGDGGLTDYWYDGGSLVMGVDITDFGCRRHRFHLGKYEDIVEWPFERPELVLCNPPFNGGGGRILYPEVFLRKTDELFGVVPMVLFCPMGFRLNQRVRSKRWRWVRESGWEITSIISMPLDVFPGVEFHNEILVWNVDGLKAHYWLPLE
jgi:hypothetical protein